jgi:hypothetical protein
MPCGGKRMMDTIFSDKCLDAIIKVVGNLPHQDVMYGGHLSLSGDVTWVEFKEYVGLLLFDLTDPPIEPIDLSDPPKKITIKKEKISVREALHRHLEYAALIYTQSKGLPKIRQPHDWAEYFKSVQAACEKLLEILEVETVMVGSKEIKRLKMVVGSRFSNSAAWTAAEHAAYKPIIALCDEAKKLQEQPMLPHKSRHAADFDFYRLVASLCIVWRDVFKKPVKASASAQNASKGGPSIRFIQEVLKPLGIRGKTPSALTKAVNAVKSSPEKYLIRH